MRLDFHIKFRVLNQFLWPVSSRSALGFPNPNFPSRGFTNVRTWSGRVLKCSPLLFTFSLAANMPTELSGRPGNRAKMSVIIDGGKEDPWKFFDFFPSRNSKISDLFDFYIYLHLPIQDITLIFRASQPICFLATDTHFPEGQPFNLICRYQECSWDLPAHLFICLQGIFACENATGRKRGI